MDQRYILYIDKDTVYLKAIQHANYIIIVGVLLWLFALVPLLFFLNRK